jgi:hypothetical protein
LQGCKGGQWEVGATRPSWLRSRKTVKLDKGTSAYC